MVTLLHILVWAVLFFGTALAAEAPPVAEAVDRCRIPQNLTSERPLAAKGPTEVQIGIYVLDIMDIDDVSQSFTTDFILSISWDDPRLSAKARGNSLIGCKLKAYDIWTPKIAIINKRNVQKRTEDILKVDAKGNVVYRQRYFGEFSSPLDLREFPFDSQVLPYSLFSQYGPEDVSLVINKHWTGHFKTFSIAGWTVEQGETHIGIEHLAIRDRDLARFDHNFSATRHSTYYIWKVILPMSLIVLMAAAIFVIASEQGGARAAISTSAVLTLIIAQFTTQGYIPRTEYLTQLDRFITGCTLLVFAALGEAVITSRFANRGRGALAHKINRWCYLLYPLSFAIVLAYSMAM